MKKPKHSKSCDVLYSKGKNDECHTQKYAVQPILKYIPKGSTIWCPFDTAESEFVQELTFAGFKVIYSHISKAQDFYTYEPKEHWDMIISNPPFTNKRLIFQRALSFGKPFALIMSNTWLNDTAPKKIFLDANKQLQLLMFDKRMLFENNGEIQKKITFSSSYFCCDFLPKDLIVEILDKEVNDSGTTLYKR